MQNIKKNYYIVQNGRATMHDKDFATKKDAIKFCMHEVELDCKVGAINNYYEIYNLLDVDRKCLYTTKGVIYKFMREQYPNIYPPKERKVQTNLFSLSKRCEWCTRFTNGKGSNLLCDYHYNEIVDKAETNVNRAIIETKIDLAKALSMSLK